MSILKKQEKRSLKNYWLQKYEQANRFEQLAREISKYIKENNGTSSKS
jgi:hypothetical protein